MSHFTEGVLQAYLDDEVAADTRAQVAAHVSGCNACAARLQELRDLDTAFTAALQGVDVTPTPAGALAELRMRARRRPFASRWAASRTALARAAMLVLGITLVAAATVPGSPVRGWLAKVWSSVTADHEPVSPVTTQEAPAAPAEEPTRTGIAPDDQGRIRILLQSLATGSRVHVVLVDGERAAVEATGRFRTAAGLLEVTGGSGEIRISLPRNVESATVEVDGRLYVTKEGADLRFLGPAADTVGAELIFRPGR